MKRSRSRVIDTLPHSHEPSIRWKVLVRVLEEDPHSTKLRDLLGLQRDASTLWRRPAIPTQSMAPANA
jgi:hypothetical protein